MPEKQPQNAVATNLNISQGKRKRIMNTITTTIPTTRKNYLVSKGFHGKNQAGSSTNSSSDDDRKAPHSDLHADCPKCLLPDENDADDEDDNSDATTTLLRAPCIGECTPSQARNSPDIPQTNKETAMCWSPAKTIRNIPLPNLAWADSQEMMQLICAKEELATSYKSIDAFDKHPELSTRMRSILYEWLMEVAEVYKLRRTTYYLTIDYIDRYISRSENMPKNQLQLLGISCLLLASKVEEIYPPRLMELAYVTDGACSEQQIINMEVLVLTALNWDMFYNTAPWWLNLYLQILNQVDVQRVSNTRTENSGKNFIYPQLSGFEYRRTCQLLDLCTLDFNIMVSFPASYLAAAAIYFTHSREKALFVSGLTWEKLKHCIAKMEPFIEVVMQSPLGNECDSATDIKRLTSGLSRTVTNITANEDHTVQKKSVDLKMLQQVYTKIEEKQGAKDDTSSSSDDLDITDTNESEQASKTSDPVEVSPNHSNQVPWTSEPIELAASNIKALEQPAQPELSSANTKQTVFQFTGDEDASIITIGNLFAPTQITSNPAVPKSNITENYRDKSASLLYNWLHSKPSAANINSDPLPSTSGITSQKRSKECKSSSNWYLRGDSDSD